MKVIEYLSGVKTHPTAEIVYKAVQKEIPTITLATVYRNLNLLAKDGDILKLEINSEFHFDADISNHQHCVCKKCGKIYDVFNEEISEFALKRMKSDEFTVENVNIIYYGECNDQKRS